MKSNKYSLAFSVAAILGLVGMNAYAASSADLTLTGSVEQDCSVSLDTASYTIDLINGEADSSVATVTEVCNDADGYVISFSSFNGGFMQNDDNADEKKNYSISYGSGTGSIDGESLSESQSVAYNTFTASNPVALRMTLPSHGTGVLAAGTWSDTITVSIAAQ